MTHIEELANQILTEMENIGAHKPKVDIYAYEMPDRQSASEVVRKALGHEPDINYNWCEAKAGRVSVVAFVKDD